MASQRQNPLESLVNLYTHDGTFLIQLTAPAFIVQPGVVVWSGRTFVLADGVHRIPAYTEAIVWVAPKTSPV